MSSITVDGVTYEVADGQNLLHACLSRGLDLPYFCWHPSMGSVGACRQCAIVAYQDEDDDRGRLVMACMTPVSDGARISIAAPQAKEFRRAVIEWLMENHPHDCPVCEEGGECHLQDMTVMTGHSARRFRGRKRTFRNQYLGPFVGHEMNRCITCYRCVRYYRDYAGGEDLRAFGSRSRMYFGRETDGVLENPFAGNLIEVCPTGVFTDRPFAQTYTRKWDLMSAPSICPGCAVGCNTLPGERYGLLKRIHNRYHGEINGYFLCDRGRFEGHFVNGERRLRQAGVRVADGSFEPLDSAAAAQAFGERLRMGGVVGIGSPRASLESNATLLQLVGTENFCRGMETREAARVELMLDVYRAGGANVPSLAEVERADAVLILGEDVMQSAPRVALAVRQAMRGESFAMAADAGIPLWQDAGVRGHAQNASSPLFIASLAPTGLDDLATICRRGTPEALAAFGFSVAAQIDARFAQADHDEDADASRRAAEALRAAERPLIVAGTGAGSAGLIEAAANVAWALTGSGCTPSLLLTGPEANTAGVGMLSAERTLDEVLDSAIRGDISTLVVLENDLFRRAESDRVARALAAVDTVIVIDVIETATAEAARLVLPAASWAESTGTFVNYETRAQRFYQVFRPGSPVAPAWRWLAQAAREAGRNDLDFEHVDAAIDAAASLPGLGGVRAAAPGAGYRAAAGMRIPRQPHRYSGRTAMTAHVSVHEPKPLPDEDTPLAYSMEGTTVGRDPATISYVWSAGWNSNQSVFKFQDEVGGSLTGGDPGVRLLDGVPPARVETLVDRFRQSPAPADPPGSGELRLVPLQEIFGTDELSALSPPIAERAPQPMVLMCPADAARLGLEAGAGVRCEGVPGSFGVRLCAELAPGMAGVYQGLGGWAAWIPDVPVRLTPDPGYLPPGESQLIVRG